MNREEIEKLIEETARKERAKKGVSVEKVRSILNVIFLLPWWGLSSILPGRTTGWQAWPLSVQAWASKSSNSFCVSCFNRLNHD